MSSDLTPIPIACRRRQSCRLCENVDLSKVLSLEPSPPANAFVPASARSIEQTSFPLDVWFCRACKHLMLLDIVDPALLFSDYVYASGTSRVFVAHFEDYARFVTERFDLTAGDLVVDVGSNDGTLLGFFKQSGQRVLGIDPAREIARKATLSGIETWPEFFDVTLSDRIVATKGAAQVITANNVFAHIDDLGGVVSAVRRLLSPKGVFVFEVSYLVDVFEKTLFDTIYHEHLDYHSVAPLVPFFARNGMQLIEAHRLPSHGGSLRGVAQLAGGLRPLDESVEALSELERRVGIDKEESFHAFGERIDRLGSDLRSLLGRLRSEGKSVAAFGAPAKATTLMHHFRIGSDVVEFIVDDSPLKQGLFTPGLHVPVLPVSAMYERRPDYVVVLAWNFADSIVKNHRRFLETGGKFIVPLPKLEIL
jgi:SAM-dependent methyltransferase